MNEESNGEEFKRVSECSALELRGDRLGNDLTFRSPNTLFEGKNISAYFKEKSAPVNSFKDEFTSIHTSSNFGGVTHSSIVSKLSPLNDAFGKSTSNFGGVTQSSIMVSKSSPLSDAFSKSTSNFGGVTQSSIMVSKSSPLNASFVSALNELSASDDTIAISEKLVRQRKAKEYERLCKPELFSFLPTSNSTVMSNVSAFDSFTFPIIRETVLNLQLPCYAECMVRVHVDNKSSNTFKICFINATFGESVEAKQLNERLISPYHSGTIDTGIVITPLKLGIFSGTLELLLTSESEYDKEARKSVFKLSCVLQSSNIEISCNTLQDPKFFMDCFVGQEFKTCLDFCLSSAKFDVLVPLEFRLLDKRISFIPGAEATADGIPVHYRCPAQNVLKTSVNSNSEFKIPVRIRPKCTVNRYEICVFLDTEKRNYIKSFFLNVTSRPKITSVKSGLSDT